MGRKTYNERIRAALDRARPDIAAEVRQERAQAYVNDLQKLTREYAGQMQRGDSGGAICTLGVLIEAASKQRDGLGNDR